MREGEIERERKIVRVGIHSTRKKNKKKEMNKGEHERKADRRKERNRNLDI